MSADLDRDLQEQIKAGTRVPLWSGLVSFAGAAVIVGIDRLYGGALTSASWLAVGLVACVCAPWLPQVLLARRDWLRWAAGEQQRRRDG